MRPLKVKVSRSSTARSNLNSRSGTTVEKLNEIQVSFIVEPDLFHGARAQQAQLQLELQN